MRIIPPTVPKLPAIWLEFCSGPLLQYVKNKYSPDARWSDKPFSDLDARFFGKGLKELSELFTEERDGLRSGRSSSRKGNYLSEAKFRSGYLLYFFPLQVTKMLTFLMQHSSSIQWPEHTDLVELHDLGAGPLSASLAWILAYGAQRRQAPSTQDPLFLTIHAYDVEASIVREGKALIEEMAEACGVRFHLVIHTGDLNPAQPLQLDGSSNGLARPQRWVLSGNFWNELRMSDREALAEGLLKQGRKVIDHWVAIEPAAAGPAQFLSRLRDELVAPESEASKAPITPASKKAAMVVVGPCLHSGLCPLAHGRDWCHFSDPFPELGKGFQLLSRNLGPKRTSLRMSKIWIARETKIGIRKVIPERLLISEVFPTGEVLTCEPIHAGRVLLEPGLKIRRGSRLQGTPEEGSIKAVAAPGIVRGTKPVVRSSKSPTAVVVKPKGPRKQKFPR